MQKEGTFATEKCPVCQFDKNENLADGTFFSQNVPSFCIFCYNFINIA